MESLAHDGPGAGATEVIPVTSSVCAKCSETWKPGDRLVTGPCGSVGRLVNFLHAFSLGLRKREAESMSRVSLQVDGATN